MKALLILLLAPLALRAELAFDQTLIEVRADLDQRMVPCDFTFTNATDQPVTIARYEANCSCLSVKIKEGKLSYQPGEKGVIRAIFDMGNFTGVVDKSVRLWLEGDPAGDPSINLTTRVHIPVLVEIEPKTLHWEVDGAAKPEARVITITMNHDDPIHVTAVESGNPTFGTDLREIEKGRKYELHVTPTSLATPGLGVIQIRTDSKSTRHASQRAFAVIRRSAATSGQ